MQYKWHFLYENHTFQGKFLHYLVIFNRNLEILMGISNAYCGTVQPHFAPKKYFDMYKLQDISLPHPSHVPANSSSLVFANGNGNHELWEYDGVAAGWPGGQYAEQDVLLPDDEVRKQRRAYFAVISFMDAQVGKVLAALDSSPKPHAERAIIALFGDHGWHIGEQNHWAKCTNVSTSSSSY